MANVMLISLEDASADNRRDTTDDNIDLTMKVEAASAAIVNYLRPFSPYEVEEDSFGEPVLDSVGEVVYQTDRNGNFICKPEVKQAVRYMVQVFYGRELSKDVWKSGFLPDVVISLLYPLRDPVMG